MRALSHHLNTAAGMTIREIFINRYGRLRSGWRVIVFAFIFMAIQLIIGLFLPFVLALFRNLGTAIEPGSYLENVVFRITLLMAALLAGLVCTRLLEGLRWRALGLTLHQGWLSHFLVGSAIGVASLALAAAIAATSGGLRFSFAGGDMMFLVVKALVSAGALFVLAALAEEALFRGYPLQTLTRAQLAWLGVLITSIPFAAGHLENPNVVKGLTFVNTALAGVWLAMAYLRTRSLWFPLGVHWAWNWTLDSVLGLPVSGLTISSQPLFRGYDVGPAWLTGGSYGIEGGVACTATLILSTLFIWRTNWVSATSEMLLLTSQENSAPTATVLSVLPTAETDFAGGSDPSDGQK